MGFTVVGLGLFGVGLIFYLVSLGYDNEDFRQRLIISSDILSGFGFGASSIALFARVAGGIYTKAADVGADLVGKVEMDIPEDVSYYYETWFKWNHGEKNEWKAIPIRLTF